MSNRPVIGLAAIHRRYFVSEEGEELISFGTFKKWSREIQQTGGLIRIKSAKNGRRQVKLVALEPFFSLWMREKFMTKPKKDETATFLGEFLRG